MVDFYSEEQNDTTVEDFDPEGYTYVGTVNTMHVAIKYVCARLQGFTAAIIYNRNTGQFDIWYK